MNDIKALILFVDLDLKKTLERPKGEQLPGKVHIWNMSPQKELLRDVVMKTDAYHEAMKPYYLKFLTGSINLNVTSLDVIDFLSESFRSFKNAPLWVNTIGILKIADECAKNDYGLAHFQYRLLELIELGYRPYISSWPVDEIHEYLSRLEVTPDYKKGELYCILSAYTMIAHSKLDSQTQSQLEKLLRSNWDFIVHLYSVMIKSIVGCRLANFSAIVNTVKLMPSYHSYAYLFYDVVMFRRQYLLSRYDTLEPKKRQIAIAKFEKHLASIQEIIERTEQKDDLELLCKTIFGKHFEASINRKRFKSYKELEGVAEHWKQEADKLQGQVQELVPLKDLVESMKKAMEGAIPMDDIVNSIVGFDDPKVSELVFNKLDWDLEDQPAWAKRRKDMKRLIKAKLQGGESFQQAMQNHLKQIAEATTRTAANPTTVQGDLVMKKEVQYEVIGVDKGGTGISISRNEE